MEFTCPCLDASFAINFRGGFQQHVYHSSGAMSWGWISRPKKRIQEIYADREFGWESEGYYIDDFEDYKI
ncbi:hypothetical protein J25TS5_09130 [Paenibacillus faecis]|nr:hypothetical protein J25TS5_09130 [Paenibacillus faecis]